MTEIDKDPILKEIRERFRRQDATIKISVNPRQLIFGNYSMPVFKGSTLSIMQNATRRFSLRFKVDSDPRVGYASQDIGLTLTQFESILVKDEYGDNNPALIISLRHACATKIWGIMPGLQEECEKSYGGNRAMARNMTVLLDPFEENSGVYCRISFVKNEELVERSYDFDVCKSLLLNDIKALWQEMNSARQSAHRILHVNRTHDFMKEMSSHSWVEYLTVQKLLKSKCLNGETLYVRSDYNPDGRRLPAKRIGQNRGDRSYSRPNPTALRDEKRASEALKRAARSFNQHREGDSAEVTVVMREIKLKELQFEPFLKRRRSEKRHCENDEEFYEMNVEKNPVLSPTIHPKQLDYYQTHASVPFPPASEFSAEELRYLDSTACYNGYGPVTEYERNDCVVANQMIPGLSGDYQNYPPYHYYQPQQQYPPETNGRVVPALNNRQYWMNSEGSSEAPTTTSPSKNHHHPSEAPPPPLPPTARDVLDMSNGNDKEIMGYFFQTGDGPTAAGSSPSKTYRATAPDGTLQKLTMRSPEKPVAEVVKKSLLTSQQPSTTKSSFVRPVPIDPVTSDTALFTFPPKHLAVSGIDPVVLLTKDVRTLDRKEFVNDNVMSFMLNYISVYMIDKKLMEKIVMNNTFFYSNLTRNIPVLTFNGRRKIDEHVHATLVQNCVRVFRWTRKFDVFKRDYIVIPINEDYHWLLITVFNPAGAIVDMSNEKKSRAKPKCYVAFFDPLSGLDPVKRNHMCHVVKTYLHELYKHTKDEGRTFAGPTPTIYDEQRVIVTRPTNTPIQSNFFDCGPFALHFIEGLFCYLDRPVTVHDFPDFDWAARYPKANEMADLMRDKVYNLVHKVADKQARSRLERYERAQRHGLSQEGDLRRSRRHSAVGPLGKRHEAYLPRRYSVNPPSRMVMDDPMFCNPREMVAMPCTQRARSLRWPEDNFPVIY